MSVNNILVANYHRYSKQKKHCY